MKNVLLAPINTTYSAKTDSRLLDALVAKECNVLMACGGNGFCATCHIYVEKGAESLTPPTDRERRTIGMLTGAADNSRLACQCRVIGEGVRIRLPEGMYVHSFDELESLIGKRTTVPVRHPQDGRILVASGKIITRSQIMKLKDTDFNIKDIFTR